MQGGGGGLVVLTSHPWLTTLCISFHGEVCESRATCRQFVAVYAVQLQCFLPHLLIGKHPRSPFGDWERNLALGSGRVCTGAASRACCIGLLHGCGRVRVANSPHMFEFE